MGAISFKTVTIASGASLSGALDNSNDQFALAGIQMPAAWTAADVTFQVSHDGTTYQDLIDGMGQEVTLLAVASRFIPVFPDDYAGIRYLKARSGSTGSPVDQGADRILTLIFKEL